MKTINKNIITCLLAGAMLSPGLFSHEIYAQWTRATEKATAKPNTSTARPSRGNTTTRSGNGNHGNLPGGNNHRPGNGNHGNRPGGNNHRPGNGNHSNRPGGNNHRPGNDRPKYRPNRPGTSVPRPGTGSKPYPHRHYYPPRPIYGRPGYHFGSWRPLPPPPPRPVYYYTTTYSAPVISAVLGLTFGTLLDYGLRSLVNSGYTVAGYQENAIFLNNVGMLGYTWPQATVYYGPSGMNGALFQYRTTTMASSPYNKVYAQLCRSYGNPVESVSDGTYRSATWWGGNSTGYVTLTAQRDYGTSGEQVYDTNLIYGTE